MLRYKIGNKWGMHSVGWTGVSATTEPLSGCSCCCIEGEVVKMGTDASLPVGMRGSGPSMKELATRGEGFTGGTQVIRVRSMGCVPVDRE